MPHDEIERYVLGQMDQAEIVSFEKEIQLNPTLSSEVDFQRQVIDAIGAARKASLKNRLAQVPVSSSWMTSALNSSWAKVATVVVVSTASILAYTQFQSEDVAVASGPMEVSLPEQQTLPDISIPDRLQRQSQVDAEAYQPQSETPLEGIRVDEVTEENEIAIEQEKLEEFVMTEVVQPDLDFEEDLDDQDVLDNQELDLAVVEVPLNIEVIASGEQRLYRYFDGSLVLKGDFQSEEYDLLELNSKKGKQYFIEISGNYYAMPESQQFRSLNPIKSKDLLSKLDSLTSLD